MDNNVDFSAVLHLDFFSTGSWTENFGTVKLIAYSFIQRAF